MSIFIFLMFSVHVWWWDKGKNIVFLNYFVAYVKLMFETITALYIVQSARAKYVTKCHMIIHKKLNDC